LSTDLLHTRLAAALRAITETDTKISGLDEAMARLSDAIADANSKQGAVNALASADAVAFERYARDGGDVPVVDSSAHHAAQLQLISAQKTAAAANAALSKLEGERALASALGQSARAAITPLALQLVFPDMVKRLADEAIALRDEARRKSTMIDEAYAITIETAELFEKGSPTALELYRFAEGLNAHTRRTHELAQIDKASVRAEITSALNDAIVAAQAELNTDKDNDIA
jgi:hypothetical protein